MAPPGTDVWIKPLSTGEFAVALVNRDDTAAHSISFTIGGDTDGTFYAGPLGNKAQVTDLFTGSVMNYTNTYSLTVPPHDGTLLRVRFLDVAQAHRKYTNRAGAK